MAENVKLKIAIAILIGVVGIVLLSLWISQCVVGDSSSITINAVRLKLNSAPTDSVFLGWDSLFGSPKDEISVHLSSGICIAESTATEIGQGQEIYPTVQVNTFFTAPLNIQLIEKDGGFLGSDDMSEAIQISGDRLNKMRKRLNDDTDAIQLKYHMTVVGGTIFTESYIFGLISGMLCINVMDFATGPAGRLMKLSAVATVGMKTMGYSDEAIATMSKFKLASTEVAELYDDVYKKTGVVDKTKIMKAIGTYQVKNGLKDVLNRPVANMQTFVKNMMLDQTSLDEEIAQLKADMTLAGLYESETDSSSDSGYDVVTGAIGDFAGAVGDITDAMEFCLDEVVGPPTDAKYYLELVATRKKSFNWSA